MKKGMFKKSKGQAIVEYIIIIVVVALAALALIGTFSDSIKTKIAGATNTLDSNAGAKVEKGDSVKKFQDMSSEGMDLDSEN